MLHPSFANMLEHRILIDENDFGEKFERIEIKNNNDKRISGILISNKTDYGTVLVAGGNAMGLKQTLQYNNHLSRKGFRILVVSYQGFGDNEGEHDLNSLTTDIKSFYDFISAKYPNEPIIFSGDSIGAIGGICSASKYNIFDGISVEGVLDPKTIPYSKAKQLWYIFPISLPIAIGVSVSVPVELDGRKCISNLIDKPVLFIHHPKDLVTPYKSAKELFDLYTGPKQFFTCTNSNSSQYHLNVTYDKDAEKEQIEFINKSLKKGEKK